MFMSLRETLGKLDTTDGVAYLLAQVLRRLSGGRARIVRYHFFAQPVPQEPKKHTRPSVKSRVRQITAADPIIAAFPRSKAVIEQRFQSGATCFVAENDGRFAGYLWLAREKYEEDEVRCTYSLTPSEHCAWDFDVYVAPDYRIGRTFARLWDAANQYLAQEGIQWSMSRITPFNIASIAAHQRLGLIKLCSATFLCIGSKQISFIPSLRRTPFLRHPTITLMAPEQDSAARPSKNVRTATQ